MSQQQTDSDTQIQGYALTMPEGFMRNGKLSVTVASNNITIALKTLAGNNPSVTEPVYAVIDGVLRTITAALSVTKNATTNWCNAGSSELATLAVHYFVYLGWNATDGVVIGFSRVPYAYRYDDFSTTSTNGRYCAISTITNAAAGDYYHIIGRFEATLSAGAGYTWSVPTFTATKLIQRPIFETGWLTWTPTLVGFSADPTGTLYIYKITMDRLDFAIVQTTNGTSNATTFTISVPLSCLTLTNYYMSMVLNTAVDNSNILTAAARWVITSGQALITLYTDMAAAVWTNANGKRARANGSYRIA